MPLHDHKHSPDEINSSSETTVSTHTPQASQIELESDAVAKQGAKRADAEANKDSVQQWPHAACKRNVMTSSETQAVLRDRSLRQAQEWILKRFDMNDCYGPSSGVKRITRLHRAIRFGIEVEPRLQEAVEEDEEQMQHKVEE